MTCKPYDIPKTLMWEAWLHVKANQGAAGIDAETIERFERKLGDNLYKLWNRMSSGSYLPPPVKAVPIPKKSGGVRILGIPTVADRIAQTTVKMWLEPQLDPIFHDDSYGYRPGKSALEAIAVTRRRCWDYDWVVEFEIRGLLDVSSHYTSRFLRGAKRSGVTAGLRIRMPFARPRYVNSLELATLYTLQDRLPRDIE